MASVIWFQRKSEGSTLSTTFSKRRKYSYRTGKGPFNHEGGHSTSQRMLARFTTCGLPVDWDVGGVEADGALKATSMAVAGL